MERGMSRSSASMLITLAMDSKISFSTERGEEGGWSDGVNRYFGQGGAKKA